MNRFRRIQFSTLYVSKITFLSKNVQTTADVQKILNMGHALTSHSLEVRNVNKYHTEELQSRCDF